MSLEVESVNYLTAEGKFDHYQLKILEGHNEILPKRYFNGDTCDLTRSQKNNEK